MGGYPVMSSLPTEVVHLYQPDDLARIEELEDAFNTAVIQGSVRSLGEDDPAQDAAKVHDDFVTEAQQRAVAVTLRAVGRKAWREIVMKHPPRDGEQQDALMGFNVQTLGDDLLAACIVEPKMSAAECEEFLDSLSHGHFQDLYKRALGLTNGGVEAAPKADLSSRLGPTSDET